MNGKDGRIEGDILTSGAEHALHDGRGVHLYGRSESGGRKRRMHAGDGMMHRRCLRDQVVLGHGEG
jgi:hypothetical protein